MCSIVSARYGYAHPLPSARIFPSNGWRYPCLSSDRRSIALSNAPANLIPPEPGRRTLRIGAGDSTVTSTPSRLVHPGVSALQLDVDGDAVVVPADQVARHPATPFPFRAGLASERQVEPQCASNRPTTDASPPVPLRCGHRRDGLGLRPVHAIGTRRNANAPSTSAPYEPANRSSAGSISTRRTTTSPSSGILSACRTGTLEFGSESSESSSASLRSAWRPSRGFARGHPDRLRHNPTRHCASR